MSQVIVLNTHIWIWFINQEFDLFPPHWREAIETAEHPLLRKNRIQKDVRIAAIAMFVNGVLVTRNQVPAYLRCLYWYRLYGSIRCDTVTTNKRTLSA